MTEKLIGSYKVRLHDPDGELVAVFDDWRGLEIRHLVNDPGYCNIRLNGLDSKVDLFEDGSLVEVWRKVPGLSPIAIPASRLKTDNWYVEWEGLHTDIRHTIHTNGDEEFISKCVGYLDFARRREILWKATSGASESKKVAIPSQTAMYEYVNENLGPAALLASGRLIDGVITGMTVPAVTGEGINWSGQRAYRNVLEVLQEIANYSDIDFDIIGAGGSNWVFETYVDQLGVDRTVDGLDSSTGLNASGNAPVIFSVKNGNVEIVVYSSSNRSSANVVVTMGQGQYAARAVHVETDASTIDAARINQRELARNANTQESANELAAMAQEWAARVQAVEDFRFRPQVAKSTIYGVHYWWGDRVTARFKELERNKRLLGVTIVVDKNGERFREWEFETIPRV